MQVTKVILWGIFSMWFSYGDNRAFCLKWSKASIASVTFVSLQTRKFYLQTLFTRANWVTVCKQKDLQESSPVFKKAFSV